MKGTHFLTTLRTGTNILRIETGRWKQENKDERKCKFCSSDEIEDEEHFLMKCHAYHDLRDCFFEKICNMTQGKVIPYYQQKNFFFEYEKFEN